jgi:hypothetical protein
VKYERGRDSIREMCKNKGKKEEIERTILE